MADAAPTGQADAAAERSAHPAREWPAAATPDIVVEVSPGVWRPRAIVEAEAEIARLRAALAEIEAYRPVPASRNKTRSPAVLRWIAECEWLSAIARAALAGEAAP